MNRDGNQPDRKGRSGWFRRFWAYRDEFGFVLSGRGYLLMAIALASGLLAMAIGGKGNVVFGLFVVVNICSMLALVDLVAINIVEFNRRRKSRRR